MRKLKLILAFFCVLSIFSIDKSFSYFNYTYSDEIKIEENIPQSQKNTDKNIKTAKSVENILKKYKDYVENSTNPYDLWDKQEIKDLKNELNLMINWIRKIQTKKVWKEVADDIIKSTLKNLKIFSDRFKKFLKNNKNLIEEKKEKKKNNQEILDFSKKVKTNSKKIKDFLKKYKIYLKESKNIKDDVKKDIKNSLDKVEKYNNILYNIDKYNIKNLDEIESKVKEAFKAINKELIKVKNLLK